MVEFNCKFDIHCIVSSLRLLWNVSWLDLFLTCWGIETYLYSNSFHEKNREAFVRYHRDETGSLNQRGILNLFKRSWQDVYMRHRKTVYICMYSHYKTEFYSVFKIRILYVNVRKSIVTIPVIFEIIL